MQSWCCLNQYVYQCIVCVIASIWFVHFNRIHRSLSLSLTLPPFDSIHAVAHCTSLSLSLSSALHGIAQLFAKRTPIALNGFASNGKSLLSINAISKCICILIKRIIYDAARRFNTLETFSAQRLCTAFYHHCDAPGDGVMHFYHCYVTFCAVDSSSLSLCLALSSSLSR